MIDEKRKHRRIPFMRPISVTKFTGEKAAVRAVDFSLEGVAFTSEQPWDIGDIITVSLNIAPTGKIKIIKALGEVVYRFKQGSEYVMGMRFYRNT